jgi:hypothetical protein
VSQRNIRVEQGDDETIDFGPILDANGAVYNATGGTATLIIKANAQATDASGTTVTGSLIGDATNGYIARFVVSSTVTATAGQRWYRAKVVVGGATATIAYGGFYVQPV